MALPEEKAGNVSQNLLYEICLFVVSNKRNPKYTNTKVNTNFIRMDTVFINSENSKNSAPHRSFFNLEDGINFFIINCHIYYINKS